MYYDEKGACGICFSNDQNGQPICIVLPELYACSQASKINLAWYESEMLPWNSAYISEPIKAIKIHRKIITVFHQDHLTSCINTYMASTSKAPGKVTLACLVEDARSDKGDTERIILILACSHYGISTKVAISSGETLVYQDIVIFGAGIAHFLASLEFVHSLGSVNLVKKPIQLVDL